MQFIEKLVPIRRFKVKSVDVSERWQLAAAVVVIAKDQDFFCFRMI